MMLDSRDDVRERTAEPGRVEHVGGEWKAPLEDREGSLFAAAIDPDGNYVQVIQLSEEHKAEVSAQAGSREA
jgi:predicted enzyme related to lactoylglutathione lyase